MISGGVYLYLEANAACHIYPSHARPRACALRNEKVIISPAPFKLLANNKTCDLTSDTVSLSRFPFSKSYSRDRDTALATCLLSLLM